MEVVGPMDPEMAALCAGDSCPAGSSLQLVFLRVGQRHHKESPGPASGLVGHSAIGSQAPGLYAWHRDRCGEI